MISPDVSERRAEALERRLARVRADEKKSAVATVMSRRDRGEGNGAPPELSITAEISAIGELLYGDRWTTGLGPRPWGSTQGKSANGSRAPTYPRSATSLSARLIARRRAAALLHLVGPGDD